tara:strand:+ start:6016 stop:6315 length:300 start_codon:yes stop_codon:yes gene_type:complete
MALAIQDDILYQKVNELYTICTEYSKQTFGISKFLSDLWKNDVLDTFAHVIVYRFNNNDDIKYTQLDTKQKQAVSSLIVTGFLEQIAGQKIVLGHKCFC